MSAIFINSSDLFKNADLFRNETSHLSLWASLSIIRSTVSFKSADSFGNEMPLAYCVLHTDSPAILFGTMMDQKQKVTGKIASKI